MRLKTIIFILWMVLCAVSYAGSALKQVCLRDACIDVEIADTDAKRQKGLMYRENLPENQGMLFIFEYEAPHRFWMKNTLIPLDIIWIDKDKRIVDIKANAAPCKEICEPFEGGYKERNCESFTPSAKALYALEVSAGFTKTHKITIGDHITF